MKISKLLIANRGEIACRIARTARAKGIATVAVYSEADADAMHVAAVDEAICIGPAPANQSYLVIDKIIDAAKRSGANAVHPGYGFLAENAEFAQACADNDIIFVGPPVSAIEAMGSKAAAKSLMADAGVPLVPGYHGDDQSLETFRVECEKIGYPVLLKASAGGGGKGMRVVESVDDLEGAIASAKREALNGFGDDRLLAEKYLQQPRHVEVQIFADGHDNTVHLYERDCSLQRRHQKVVEEAPAPGLSAELRAEFGEAGVAAARAIDYRGAGTVEFIMDQDGTFYFMEMNTRLQVEHPVTELITGLDLVDWQLRVAEGQPLPLAQGDILLNGHAFEVRLYAENPARNFLPQTGELVHLRYPETSDTVRIDTGVKQGGEVTPFYDPMIAKLVVWGEDRSTALGRLSQAIGQVELVGLETNIAFLKAIADHPAFAAGEVDTGFIERHLNDLVPDPGDPPSECVALMALGTMLKRADDAAAVAESSGDPHSPWGEADGWRLNDDNHHDLTFLFGETETSLRVHFRADGYSVEFGDSVITMTGSLTDDGSLDARIGDRSYRARIVDADPDTYLFVGGEAYRFHLVDRMADIDDGAVGGGRLTAPMPGKVIRVDVADGQPVSAGDSLMVLEAMKMEHTISALVDGTVVTVNFETGDSVEEGSDLVEFEASEE